MEFIHFRHHECEINFKAMLNSSSDLYKSEWLDLVFKNRNKSYGAYLLRAESAGITTRAFLIAAPIFIMLFAGPMIYSRLHPEVTATSVEMDPVTAVAPPEVHEPPVKKIEPPAPEKAEQKVKSFKMVANIKVVDKPEIDETMPDLKDLKDAVVGQVTQDGIATKASVAPAVGDGNGSGIGTAPATDNTVYDGSTIEKYPEFEGGMAAWSKFIQRNLRYPSFAAEEGIQGKVFVSFVVEIDGSVTAVSIIRGIGGGCDEEAMRVIKKSPKWRPGQQNKQNVRVRYTMPLSFVLGQ